MFTCVQAADAAGGHHSLSKIEAHWYRLSWEDRTGERGLQEFLFFRDPADLPNGSHEGQHVTLFVYFFDFFFAYVYLN